MGGQPYGAERPRRSDGPLVVQKPKTRPRIFRYQADRVIIMESQIDKRRLARLLDALPDDIQDLVHQWLRKAGGRPGYLEPRDRRAWAFALTRAEDCLEMRRGSANEAARMAIRPVRRALEDEDVTGRSR